MTSHTPLTKMKKRFQYVHIQCPDCMNGHFIGVLWDVINEKERDRRFKCKLCGTLYIATLELSVVSDSYSIDEDAL